MGKRFSSCVAEGIGTFALILIGAGSICMNVVTEGKLGITGIAFAHGLTIMVMAAALGHISGGHFNPAVTVSMWATGRQKTTDSVIYIIAQLIGAGFAGLLLGKIVQSYDILWNPPFLGVCDLGRIGWKGGVAVEAILTFFLVTVIFGTTVDSRGPKAIAPLTIGMTITAGILLGGPLTGAALNPARAFGPALASGHWNNHCVYWLGPILGAVAAGFLYDRLFLKQK